MGDRDELLSAVGKWDDDLLVRELDDAGRLEGARLYANELVEKNARVGVASASWHELDYA
jgi:hypothetical protein